MRIVTLAVASGAMLLAAGAAQAKDVSLHLTAKEVDLPIDNNQCTGDVCSGGSASTYFF